VFIETPRETQGLTVEATGYPCEWRVTVAVAVIVPVLSGFVRQKFKATAVIDLPPWMDKHGALLLFSLITAVIRLAG